jgi:hypothetical protein
MTWNITIPLEIPSQNATGKGRTWRARAAATKRVRTAWRYHCLVAMAQVCAMKATAFRSLHIIAYRKQRCADIANLIGGAKACVDGMVDAGLLVDDRDTMARITYEQHAAGKSPNRRPCTILTVTE